MSRPILSLRILILILPLFFLFFSCRKNEKIDTNPSLKLEFSTDTVIFDTVFTTVGSVTQRLMVYNRNKSTIQISSIRMGSGGNSNFSINIDGLPANTGADNIELSGKDSIFILVRVTVDPTNQNTPLIIADSLIFTTNGNIQDVKLIAWGQDAIFHQDEDLQGAVTWDSLKPHVIYGHLRVDTLGALTVEAGTKIYLHKFAYLAVSSGATLKLLGNLEHPVRIQGDRTDEYYRDLPGHWDGIYLEKGSTGHSINHAIIKNGENGLVADSSASPGTTFLTISNTIIRNMSKYGLYAYSTSIRSENLVIGDCGVAALTLEFGGDYDFRHLTIGNYWSSAVRNTPSVYISNYTYFETQKAFNPLTKAYFGNAIIYGAMEEEIQLSLDPAAQGEYTFDHAMLKTLLPFSDPNRFISCEKNIDPVFVDPPAFDYKLDSLSPAIDKGIPMGVPFDILGVDRGAAPDLGAYERP